MNKRISLLLVLSLVLGMFAPMATYAEEVDTTEAKELVNLLRDEITGDKIDIELERYITENKASIEKLINSQYDKLKELITDNNEAKVEERYGITKDKLDKLKGQSIDALNADGLRLENAIKYVREGEDADEEDALNFIQGYINTTRDILDKGFENSSWKEEILKEGEGYKDLYKVLSNEFRNTVKGFEETCVGDKKSVEIVFEYSSESDLIKGLKNSSIEIHKLLEAEAPKWDEDREEKALNYINSGKKEVEEKLNEKYTDAVSTKLEKLTKSLGFKFEAVDCPDQGGEDGGTVMPPSTGVTPPSTATEYREDKDNKEVFLDEKHLDIKKVGDKTTIKISDKHVSAAIAQLKKSLGTEAKDMTLTVKVPEGTGFNVDFELSGKAIKTLADNKVDFKVSSSKGSLVLPFDALDAKTFADNEIVKLKLDKIENRVISEKVRDEDAVKKAADIYLERTKDGKATRINEINKPLRAVLNVKDLGNKDLLALYNMNNKMKFITGKIRKENMTFKIEELGKHVLVETHMGYNDTKTHWAKDEIESMTAKNVVNGVGKNLFKPNAKVTRAEFAKMIVASLEVDLVEYDGSFKDVKKTDWFAQYVSTAHELGIVKGKSADTFKPNENITREEMATMLSRLDDKELTKEEVNSELKKYKDASKVSEWARPYVAKASKLGIMTGKKIGLDPRANATRAEAATTMFRIYNIY